MQSNAVECSRVKGYDVVVKFGKTMIHSFLKSQKPRFTLWFLRYEGKMEIIYKKLNDIKEYRNNPRKNDEAVGAVAESIKEFGFKVPIVIDKNNYPDELITAAMIRGFAGAEFTLLRGEGHYATALDSQKETGKKIFGGGFLISEAAAMAKAAAKAEAKAKAKAEEEFLLSEREINIVKSLGD